MKYEIGDSVGMGWCLETLAWVAAAKRQFGRTAWLLGAADPLWEKAGSRLSGNAIMEQFHQRAAAAAQAALGAQHYDALRRLGAANPLAEIVRLAATQGAEPPAVAGGKPRPAGRIPSHRDLSDREREIAALVSEGMSNRQIAERLRISKRTVDSHVEHILAKLHVRTRVQIATRMSAGPGPDQAGQRPVVS